MLIQFLYTYKVRLHRTDCFSGHTSQRVVTVTAGTMLDVTVVPSVRRRACGRKTFLCPQFSDITLGGSVHPDVMVEVPNDIWREPTPEQVLAYQTGISEPTIDAWIKTGFLRRISPQLITENWGPLV